MTAEQQAKAYKKALVSLTASVVQFELALDKAMTMPERAERGKTVAKLTNWLTMQNQSTMLSVLGYSWPKINRMYEIKNK